MSAEKVLRGDNPSIMPPQPLESIQNAAATDGGGFTTEAARGGTISLAMLIDFIIQRTYHELTVLAEL